MLAMQIIGTSQKRGSLFLDNGRKLLQFSSAQSITRKCRLFVSPPTRPPLQVNGAAPRTRSCTLQCIIRESRRAARLTFFFLFPVFRFLFSSFSADALLFVLWVNFVMQFGRPVIDRAAAARCREPCQFYTDENREGVTHIRWVTRTRRGR